MKTRSEFATISQELARRLFEAGSRHVFLVPGLHVDPLLHSLAQGGQFSLVTCAHESGAGFMADGYARAGERLGACVTIGSVGASNLITAANTARVDRSRVLYITGSAPTAFDGMSTFQDTELRGRDLELLALAAGRSTRVSSHEALDFGLSFLREEGRGPGHIQIPYDIQGARLPWEAGPPTLVPSSPVSQNCVDSADRLAELLRASRRAVMLVGENEMSDRLRSLVGSIARLLNTPVATTLGAKGAMADTCRLALGVFGYGGTSRAYSALTDEAVDLLIVVAADIDERNTLGWSPALLEGFRTIAVLGDAEQRLPRPISTLEHLTGSATSTLELLREKLNRHGSKRQDPSWTDAACSASWTFPEPNDWSSPAPIHPGRMLHEASDILGDLPVCVDSGAHRLFAGHYWRSRRSGLFFTAARTAPMGWAIAAGIGVSLARDCSKTVIITGDGCMGMHGMEFQTAVRYSVPILVIVSNNEVLGNVHMRYRGEGIALDQTSALGRVDWVAFARALGGDGLHVEDLDELGPALEKGRLAPGPFILDVSTLSDASVPDALHASSAYAAPLTAVETFVEESR